MKFKRLHPKVYFLKGIPISPQTFAFIVYSGRSKKISLVKQIQDSPYIVPSTNSISGTEEGLFANDGMLHKDPRTGNLLYIYFYKNKFFYLDSNLNQIFIGRTIDTISQPEIKVTRIKSSHKTTMSAPPITVNKKSCISSDWLFVNSGLLANNETKQLFDSNSVIDVYSLKNGKYQFSFYLQEFKGKKMSSFRVFGKLLVAIYDSYLISYNLNF